MAPTILITGGAGYIGSHTVLELLAAGRHVVIVDNFCNSSPKVIERLHQLGGDGFDCLDGDVRDAGFMVKVFERYQVAGVIHFAGLKAVGESVAQPLRYYDNNIGSTLCLLQAMQAAGVRDLVFSSSATVYGDPEQVPIPETAALQVTNPYGATKRMCEDILRDLMASDPSWHIAILRYFNPVGAHVSGLIGEDPNDVPNNLMPFITQVAVGKRPFLSIFGNDYATPDGTGVRDYIHVTDLARGHLAALNYLTTRQASITVNLGRGVGVSVKELMDVFARVSGQAIAHQYAPRRAGDIAACYADIRLAASALGWQAQLDVERMCADAWRWQSMNPNGY
jgi:UDP-glucose 4-epimerase